MPAKPPPVHWHNQHSTRSAILFWAILNRGKGTNQYFLVLYLLRARHSVTCFRGNWRLSSSWHRPHGSSNWLPWSRHRVVRLAKSPVPERDLEHGTYSISMFLICACYYHSFKTHHIASQKVKARWRASKRHNYHLNPVHGFSYWKPWLVLWLSPKWKVTILRS